MNKYYEYSVINDVDYFIVDLSPVLFPIIQACILLEWDFLKLSILFTTHHCRIYLLVIKPYDFTLVGSLASEFLGWTWNTNVGIPMLDIGIPTLEFQCPT